MGCTGAARINGDSGIPGLGLRGIYFFPHLALAALAAIWERFFGVNLAALAVPPLKPPKRPNATACGFLEGSTTGGVTSLGSYFGTWPVASWMMRYASWLGSRGRALLERSDMPQL